MKKRQYVTELKTNRRGVFLKADCSQSIEFWIVRWEGETRESKISKSLILEGQWNYCPTNKKLLPVGV